MSVLSKIIKESISHSFIAEILQHLSTTHSERDKRTRDRVLHSVAELLRVRLEEESSQERLGNFAGSGYGIDEFGDVELLNFFLRNDV
jgi:hypothetical protein